MDEALALTDGDLTPWVSNARSGAAFKTASNIYEGLFKHVNAHAVDALAAGQLHGLIDGGYTDNTAVAHAVAAGADEVSDEIIPLAPTVQ